MPRRPTLMQAASNFPEMLFAAAKPWPQAARSRNLHPTLIMAARWNSSRASSRVTPEQFREAPNTNAEGAPRAARGLPTESQRKANRTARAEARRVA